MGVGGGGKGGVKGVMQKVVGLQLQVTETQTSSNLCAFSPCRNLMDHWKVHFPRLVDQRF